jgi:hypothetical protein
MGSWHSTLLDSIWVRVGVRSYIIDEINIRVVYFSLLRLEVLNSRLSRRGATLSATPHSHCPPARSRGYGG